jgi:hypothetical protein
LPSPPKTPLVERRLRWAGILIAVGLVIQLMTFVWMHPLAFIAFAVISCPLVAAGVLLFLCFLVSHQPSQDRHAGL